MRSALILIVCFIGGIVVSLVSCKEDYGDVYYPMTWSIDSDSFNGSVEASVDKDRATVSCGSDGGSVSLMMSIGLQMHGYKDESGKWVDISDSVIRHDWCEVSVKGRQCTVKFPEDKSMKSHRIEVCLDNFMCTSGGFLILSRQP